MTSDLSEALNTISTSAGAALLTPYELGTLSLPNRVVMSPMTRARSTNGVPTLLEAEYYSQRASAGLIITGGIYISQQAVGGINVPGIYTDKQVEEWTEITESVHSSGGRIFAQLSHSGAVSHPSLLNGQLPVAPSTVNPKQKVVSSTGYVDTVEPRALTIAEIKSIVEDYRTAAANAKVAGFDGVELHGANVYLIPQFLNTSTNHRQDAYGGSPENRARIVLEILTAIGTVWEHNRIGVKLSPSITGVGALSAMDHILAWLSDFAPAYLHLRRGFDTTGMPIEMLREHTFDHFRDFLQRNTYRQRRIRFRYRQCTRGARQCRSGIVCETLRLKSRSRNALSEQRSTGSQRSENLLRGRGERIHQLPVRIGESVRPPANALATESQHRAVLLE